MEEETEEMTAEKVKSVNEGKNVRDREKKRPLQYDYLLQQIKNDKKPNRVTVTCTYDDAE